MYYSTCISTRYGLGLDAPNCGSATWADKKQFEKKLKRYYVVFGIVGALIWVYVVYLCGYILYAYTRMCSMGLYRTTAKCRPKMVFRFRIPSHAPAEEVCVIF